MSKADPLLAVGGVTTHGGNVDTGNPKAGVVGDRPAPGPKGHPQRGNALANNPVAAAAEGEKQAKEPRGA